MSEKRQLTSEQQETKDTLNLFYRLARRVSIYTDGEIGWVSIQEPIDVDDPTYGFIVGDGFASCTVSEARNADDKFVRKLAADVLGFQPDSVQDVMRRMGLCQQSIRSAQDDMEQAQYRLEHALSEMESLQKLLEKANG